MTLSWSPSPPGSLASLFLTLVYHSLSLCVCPINTPCVFEADLPPAPICQNLCAWAGNNTSPVSASVISCLLLKLEEGVHSILNC